MDPKLLIAEICMSHKQRRVCGVLADHFGQWVHPDTIVNGVWFDDPNGGPNDPRNNVAVHIIRVAPILSEYGLVIDRKAGPGGGRRLRWAVEERVAA